MQLQKLLWYKINGVLNGECFDPYILRPLASTPAVCTYVRACACVHWYENQLNAEDSNAYEGEM